MLQLCTRSCSLHLWSAPWRTCWRWHGLSKRCILQWRMTSIFRISWRDSYSLLQLYQLSPWYYFSWSTGCIATIWVRISNFVIWNNQALVIWYFYEMRGNGRYFSWNISCKKLLPVVYCLCRNASLEGHRTGPLILLANYNIANNVLVHRSGVC